MNLKECPFCGDKANIVTGASGIAWCVECVGCGASTKFYLSEEEAIKAWQERVSINTPAEEE